MEISSDVFFPVQITRLPNGYITHHANLALAGPRSGREPVPTHVVTTHLKHTVLNSTLRGARCSSVLRAFAHGAMGRRIGPSWGGPIELFLVPASAPRLV